MKKDAIAAPEYDFCGWATKANVRCTDGRIIDKDAFAHCDGKEVSLAWNHNNMSPFDILGKVKLESHPEGLYAFGYFNDTDAGRTAKQLVQHGDIGSMSICATNVRENANHVYFGNIKEVSLVQSGANKEAVIEYVIRHSDEEEPSMFMFALGEDLCEFWHSEEGKPSPAKKDDDDDDEKEPEEKDDKDDDKDDAPEAPTKDEPEKDDVDDIVEKMTPDQKKRVLSKLSGKEIAHADNGGDGDSGDDGGDDDGELSEEEAIKLFDELPQEKKDAIFAFINKVIFDDTIKHSEYDPYEPTNVAEIIRMLPDTDADHRLAAAQIIDYSVCHREEIVDEIMHSADDEQVVEGDDDMKYNPFEGTPNPDAKQENTFSHSDYANVVKMANENHCRFSQAVTEYCRDHEVEPITSFSHADGDTATQYTEDTVAYGVRGMDYLFPDARNLTDRPIFIKRDTDWVSEVFEKTTKVPALRLRSIFANITEDEARAKGYVKGNKKFEEVFPLLKRETYPDTIYKMQKFDRDDLLDIEDPRFVSWIKDEMMVMYREEVARAILVGDGRATTDTSKIKEDRIRPIWTDEDLYTYKKVVTPGATSEETVEKIIEAIIRARKYYKGSGNPTFFTTEDFYVDMLLLKDKIGRRLYSGINELNGILRVSKTVTVPIMENLKRNGNSLVGIIVNMSDYSVGIKDNSRTTWFDHFDIDFNQYKYLVESRMSGTLNKPYSAIAIELAAATGGNGGTGGNG